MFWIILTSTFLIEDNVSINKFVPRFARGTTLNQSRLVAIPWLTCKEMTD